MRRLALLLILCGCDTEPEPKTESAQKPATNSPTIAQSTPEWQAELYALQRELANGNADRKKALDFIASRQFGTLEEALTAAGPDVMPGTVVGTQGEGSRRHRSCLGQPSGRMDLGPQRYEERIDNRSE